MANMVEGGTTPNLSAKRLHELGYRIAAYPLTLLSAAMRAMGACLEHMRAGRDPAGLLMGFDELKRHVGFDHYDRLAARYATRGGGNVPG